MRLIALGQLTYAGAALAAGDPFEASDTDAFILINASRPLARRVEVERDPSAQSDEKKPVATPAPEKTAARPTQQRRRTYQRADMKAASGE